MDKKFNTAIIISLISVLIAILSFLFAYVNYQESRKITFKWEAKSENNVLVKLERGVIDEEGKPIQTFDLPLWIEFKVTNTGLRTFSVDSIWVIVNGSKKDPEMFKKFYNRLTTVDPTPPNIRGGVVSNEISFPLVVDPGHSKKFYKKIKLPISDRLYDAYRKAFKGEAFSIGDIFRLNNDDTRVSSYFKIYAEIELAGGEKINTHVDIDGGDSK
jgi:hypothetical protein